jgi:hypothetical protein
MSRTVWLLAMSPTPSATPPNTTPSTANPAVQAASSPRCSRQARTSRTRPGRQHARADVAPRGQHHGRGGEHGGQARDDGEQPPALAAVGADALDQADRRQPRQPRQPAAGLAAEVAGDPQHVGRAEGRHGDPPGAAGVAGELRGDGADRGEQPAGGRQLQPQGQRSRDRQVLAPRDDGHQRRQDEVGAQGRGQRRRQARVAPDHGGAEQLAAAALLLDAGVPDDREQADQPHDHGDEPGPPGDELAEAGAGQAAVEPDQPSVVGVLQALGGRREGFAQRLHVDQHDDGQVHDPQWQQRPVAPQDQADQPARADQGAHRATSAVRCPPSAEVFS